MRGFLGAGTRRLETVEGEFLRVLWNFAGITVLIAVAFGLFILHGMLVGPWVSVAAASVGIILFGRWMARQLAGEPDDSIAILVVYVVTAFCLAGWLVFGERLIGEWWPPTLEIGIETWLKVWINLPFLGLYVAIRFGLYALVVELVDPEHTMRHGQLNRIKPIWPGSSEEFYAGEPMRQPERVIELQTVEAPPRDLLLSIPRPRARGLDRVVLHTLNTGEWHDYLNAVLADLGKPGPYQRVTLAEKQASRFGITQTWFNSVRDQLIDAGLWFWVDETDHSKGLGMTPSFVLFMLAFTSQASPLPRSPEGEGEPPTSLPARTQEAG